MLNYLNRSCVKWLTDKCDGKKLFWRVLREKIYIFLLYIETNMSENSSPVKKSENTVNTTKSSDYVPVKKKKYVGRLVELEAENKALRNVLRTYEDILKAKLVERKIEIPKAFEFPDEIQKDAENLLFKKDVYTYIKNPAENIHLISNVVKYMTKPKKNYTVNSNNVKMFLQNF